MGGFYNHAEFGKKNHFLICGFSGDRCEKSSGLWERNRSWPNGRKYQPTRSSETRSSLGDRTFVLEHPVSRTVCSQQARDFQVRCRFKKSSSGPFDVWGYLVSGKALQTPSDSISFSLHRRCSVGRTHVRRSLSTGRTRRATAVGSAGIGFDGFTVPSTIRCMRDSFFSTGRQLCIANKGAYLSRMWNALE